MKWYWWDVDVVSLAWWRLSQSSIPLDNESASWEKKLSKSFGRTSSNIRPYLRNFVRLGYLLCIIWLESSSKLGFRFSLCTSTKHRRTDLHFRGTNWRTIMCPNTDGRETGDLTTRKMKDTLLISGRPSTKTLDKWIFNDFA